MLFSLVPLLAATVLAAPAVEKRSVTGNAIVNLNVNTGTPQHLASGFIYGLPDTKNQIPDHFYTDIKFGYSRAGGAQVAAPGRGWIWGLAEYKKRFASALSNYQTTIQHGGKFIFLIHDLWGADGTQNATAAYPGDNGDWRSWDNYLTHFISDMKAAGATKDLIIDIWNEPDLKIFWNRPQAQWIQMWGRTYHRLAKDFPAALTTGPSLANFPSTSNTWWTSWARFIASNQSIPTQYAWHMEGGSGDMTTAVSAYKAVLSAAGLATTKQININEYATFAEQVPTAGAWWIAQLERHNALGLRGNWLSGNQLHDFFAGLLGKPGAGTSSYSPTAGGYYPSPEFNVYKYYAQTMTGYRVSTTPTPDTFGDVYATVASDKIRLLVGARIQTGTWNVQLNGLTSLGFPSSGTINIQTYGFPGSATNHFLREDATTYLGVVAHTYTGGVLVFPIFQTDAVTTWAFEITR